jgi:Ni,Fe-hydrogenase III large subunit
MAVRSIVSLPNGGVARLGDIPRLRLETFREVLTGAAPGGRLVSFFGMPEPDNRVRLVAILARTEEPTLVVTSTEVGESYPALTPDLPQAHLFEREIAEQWGVRPEGHPWLKPVRYHRSYRAGRDAWDRAEGEPFLPGVADFFEVEGEEVHEVAVGPVHAGVIEPGHFRFQCHGERVIHLEIALGYQHRGVERSLEGGPDKRTIHLVEAVAGDSAVGHALAFSQLVEGLSGAEVPPRARAIRAVALELERLANHAGDLGALAGDVGYLPAASFCGRIRGDLLNLTLLACGNRMGFGWVRPGGVGFGIDFEPATYRRIVDSLPGAVFDLESSFHLMRTNSTVRARFEETGALPRATCEELGIVGVAARASGAERDVRQDHPLGRYAEAPLARASWTSGDVFARARVRWEESATSAAYVLETLRSLPRGASRSEPGPLEPQCLAVSLVEGWRGEICHTAVTDERGRFRRYKIVDPSFHNWMGLAMAMRDQPISDFPLCNKSFNLSYSGHDL